MKLSDHDIEVSIAVSSMRPQPGTERGDAWIGGARWAWRNAKTGILDLEQRITELEAKLAAAENKLKSIDPIADEVSINGMYDCHLFHRIQGASVDEIITNWLDHIANPIPAEFEDGSTRPDLGPSNLCPAIVLSKGKELRRVGKMVFPDYRARTARNEEDLEAYRQALTSDPDVPRLLAAMEASHDPVPEADQRLADATNRKFRGEGK